MKRCIRITKISHLTYKAKFLFHALLIFSLFLIILPNALAATTHYVRAGATGSGNGSDWINAWTDLPSSFVRGDTYYIADGTYGVHDFATAESGSTYIYIYKATGSDHGTGTGWSSSYGDGQAHFNGDPALTFSSIIEFSSGYWVFDGKTGSGSTSSSYGFKISPVTPTRQINAVGMPAQNDGSNQLDHITFSHTAIILPGSDYEYQQYGIISKATPESARATNMTISNNYIANATVNMLAVRWTDGVIENNYFYNNWSSPTYHGEQLVFNNNCTNVIIRGNFFKDSYTFAIGWHKNNSGEGVNYHTGFQIYNNIVSGVNTSISCAFANADSGTVDIIKGFEFHHNTFYNITPSHAILIGNLTNVATDHSYAYNNLFYNCSNPKLSNVGYTAGAIVHTYNAFFDCTGTYDGDEGGTAFVGTGDPFVDSARGDFHLISSINIDAGASDIETYPPPPEPPTPNPSQPTGLSIISG